MSAVELVCFALFKMI